LSRRAASLAGVHHWTGALLRSRLNRIVQIAVTLGLLGWLLSSLDASSWEAIRNFDLGTLALPILLFASAQVFGGLRLVALLADPRLSAREAIVTTWIGYFAANFLPSTVGGDVVRALRLKALGIPLARAAGALVLDRLINLAMIGAILCLSAWSWVGALAGSLDRGVATLAIAASGLGGALTVLLAWRSPGVRRSVAEAAQPLLELLGSPLRLALAAALSLSSVGVAILAQWLIARRLGMSIGLAELAGVICVVTLIVLLPVSLNGLGLQEGSFVVLLTRAGEPFDAALAFALLARVLIVAAGVIGGAVLAWDRIAVSSRVRRS
jgi:uncharacterized membrane protein YbhN (UPF0104 family)